MKAGCSLDDLEQIARAGVRFALKGDVAWARWLTEQLGTVAAQKIEQRITSTIAFTDDISKILADPDATTRLLDAVQGQTIAVPAVATNSKSEAKAVGNGNGTAAH